MAALDDARDAVSRVSGATLCRARIHHASLSGSRLSTRTVVIVVVVADNLQVVPFHPAATYSDSDTDPADFATRRGRRFRRS